MIQNIEVEVEAQDVSDEADSLICVFVGSLRKSISRM